MVAVNENHVQVVRLLLEAGADPNTEHDQGATALGWAASGGHAQEVELLLEHGADVNLGEPCSGLIPLPAQRGRRWFSNNFDMARR